MNSDLPQRKNNRKEGFDYSAAGAYFITICTQNRRQILSHIVGGDVLDAPQIVGDDVLDAPSIELFYHGKIADKYINQLSDFYSYMEVDHYVIMPNHIHMILIVYDHENMESSAKQHTPISRFISTFKRFCNKEYGEDIWQRGFMDHIIRNREDYQQHLKYIVDNPVRWHFDELYGD